MEKHAEGASTSLTGGKMVVTKRKLLRRMKIALICQGVLQLGLVIFVIALTMWATGKISTQASEEQRQNEEIEKLKEQLNILKMSLPVDEKAGEKKIDTPAEEDRAVATPVLSETEASADYANAEINETTKPSTITRKQGEALSKPTNATTTPSTSTIATALGQPTKAPETAM